MPRSGIAFVTTILVVTCAGWTAACGDDNYPYETCPCYDLMCPFYSRCLDDRTIERYTQEKGYCGCKGECWLHNPEECPEGTYCYSDAAPDAEGYEAGVEGSCRGNECNVEENLLCPGYAFCDTRPGVCGGPGACIGDRLHLFGPEIDWEYTCGCDGVTYKGWAQRVKGRASVSHEGRCYLPERLGLTQENKENNTIFVVCAGKDSTANLPDDLAALLVGATYGQYGPAVSCQEGDAAYVGNLILDETGAVTQAQYDGLVSLASFPGISKISGHQAGYCEQNCYTGKLCSETECPSPCGCCPCERAAKRCDDANSIGTCSSDGCWKSPIRCDLYSACISDEEGVRCEFTCAELLTFVRNFAAKKQPCTEEEQCRTFAAFCQRFDGPCWLPWNGNVDLEYYAIKRYQTEWLELGCHDAESCDCGEAPTAHCINGNCVFEQ